MICCGSGSSTREHPNTTPTETESYDSEDEYSCSEATTFPSDVYGTDPIATLVDWDAEKTREQLTERGLKQNIANIAAIAKHLFSLGVTGRKIKRKQKGGFKEELQEHFSEEECDEFRKFLNKLFRRYLRESIPDMKERNDEDTQLEKLNARHESRVMDSDSSLLRCVAKTSLMSKLEGELVDLNWDNEMSKCIPQYKMVELDLSVGSNLIGSKKNQFLYSSYGHCFKHEEFPGEVRMAVTCSGIQYDIKELQQTKSPDKEPTTMAPTRPGQAGSCSGTQYDVKDMVSFEEQCSWNSKMPGEVRFLEKQLSNEHRQYVVAIVRCDSKCSQKLYCAVNVMPIMEELPDDKKFKAGSDTFSERATFRKRFSWRFPGLMEDVLSKNSKNDFILDCNKLLDPVQCLDILQDSDAHVSIIVSGNSDDVQSKYEEIKSTGLSLSNGTTLKAAGNIQTGNFCGKTNNNYREIIPFTPCDKAGLYMYLIYRQASRELDEEIVEELRSKPFDVTVRKWTSRANRKKGFKLRAMNIHVVDKDKKSKKSCSIQ